MVLVWLAAVRPNNDKSLSERISDDYSQYSAELDEANGAAQTFDTDNDLLAHGLCVWHQQRPAHR